MKFLICMILATVNAAEIIPGVKTRISQECISYFGDVASTLATTYVREQTIESVVSSTTKHWYGDMSYEVYDLTLKGFNELYTQVEMSTDNVKLTFSTEDSVIYASWRYKFGLVKDSGLFEIDIERAFVSMDMFLNVDENGKPAIQTINIRAEINNFDVSCKGTSRCWLYTFILNHFKGTVLQYINPILQNQIKKTVDETIVPLLSKITTSVEISPAVHLDYGLVAKPIINSNYIELAHKAEVFYGVSKSKCPYVPTPLTPPAQSTHMISMHFSEYMFNTWGCALHNSGVLNYVLSQASLPDDKKSYLASNCKEDDVCFGAMFIEDPTQYTGSDIQVSFKSTKAPKVAFSPDLCTINSTVHLEIYTHYPNLVSRRESLVVAVGPAIIHLNTRIVGTKIFFSVLKIISDLKIVNTVTVINDISITLIVNQLSAGTLLPYVNIIGETGISIPTNPYVKFYNTGLKISKGMLTVETDASHYG